MKLQYTKVEGGQLITIDCEETIYEIESKCQNEDGWIEDKNCTARGNIKRTVIVLKGTPECIIAQSIFLSNGKIWDSYLRDFR